MQFYFWRRKRAVVVQQLVRWPVLLLAGVVLASELAPGVRASTPEHAPPVAAEVASAKTAGRDGASAVDPEQIAAQHAELLAAGREPAEVLRQARRCHAQRPDSLSSAAWLLVSLDEPSLRKKHLGAVVDAADRVIARVKSTEMDAERRTAWLADALYRKGRALGYMELPDVLEVRPIADPERHHERFEATFKELDSLVDTTEPQFILLRIRRERRLGNFDEALRLLEIYRAKAADPRWYEKKHKAILQEAKAPRQAESAP